MGLRSTNVTSDSNRLTETVRRLAGDARKALGPHPSLEELIAYHTGETGASGREAVREHIALCPACAHALLDIVAFPDLLPQEERGRLAEDQLAAEWQRLRSNAGLDKGGSLLLGRRWFRWPVGLLRPVVAVLLLAVAALSLWNVALLRRLGGLGHPRINVAVEDLAPETATRRGNGENIIRLPAKVDSLLLVLNLTEEQASAVHREYEIEIVDSHGRVAWQGVGLRKGEAGIFTIQLPRKLLTSGALEIEVYGRDGRQRVSVAGYHLEIVYQ